MSHIGFVCMVPSMMPCSTLSKGKGKNMAEPQETRQEQEARWDAQRAAREKASQAGQRARQKKSRRIWLTVIVIVIIAGIAAVVLL
jgi:hypothetical protein